MSLPAGVDADAWSRLIARPIAHRGLWSEPAPENSLAAFEAAASAGYGVEFDVQLSADGEAVVFHDDRLDRLTTSSGRVGQTASVDLARTRLMASAETVPTLAETLARIGGRVLVLIELKVLGGDEGPLEQRVAEILDRYRGPAAVISFNPVSIGWFAEYRPNLLRGLNSTGYHDATAWPLRPEQRRALADLEHAALARPHFLSLGLDMLPSERAAAMRRDGTPVIAWTVRTPEQWERTSGACDNYMFEGFRP